MRSAMAVKTKAVLAVGFVIFVVGTAGAAYIGSHGSGGTSGTSVSSSATELYATRTVDVGTAGATAVASGLIKTKKVAVSALPADAVTDVSQLNGRVSVVQITAGTTVTSEMFPAPQTHIGTIVIPPGKRALALQMSPEPGVAGFAGAGDLIDVYVISKGDSGAPAGAKLILQSVQVLNVNGVAQPTSQGQPGGPNLVYLLAVTPAQAERLIYLNAFDSLYFDLVPKGDPAVTTPGAGPGDTFSTL